MMYFSRKEKLDKKGNLHYINFLLSSKNTIVSVLSEGAFQFSDFALSKLTKGSFKSVHKLFSSCIKK